MGHDLDVVAEQIQPLTPDDVSTIHQAQTCPLDMPYEAFCKLGKRRLVATELGVFIEPEFIQERAYQFLAGLQGVSALKEYLVYRKIQDQKDLSVDEAKSMSHAFTRMPDTLKRDLTTYIDDLLLPIHGEAGVIYKTELDLICQNISGALFASIGNEHLNMIFRNEVLLQQGEVVCEQGRQGKEMYLIKRGRVSVYIDDACMASLSSGEIFGEISLFYNTRRSATIKAAVPNTRLGVLTREDLEALFESGEPYLNDLIYRLYTILPDRLRNLNDKYKAAIRFLHLLSDGDATQAQSLEHAQLEVEREQTGILPTISEEEARRICCETRTFEADAPIFSENDEPEGAYFVLAGKVRVFALSEDLQDILLGELGPGEIFGEMALIDDKPRSASVTTLAPCKLGFISKAGFDEFIRTKSDLAFRLMGFICLSIFRRILRLDRLYSSIKKRIEDS